MAVLVATCIVGVQEAIKAVAVATIVVNGINSALLANLLTDVLLKIIPVPFMLSLPFPLHINTTVNCCKHVLYPMLLVVPDSNVNLLRLDLSVHMILPPVHM